MALPIWQTPSGLLDTVQERILYEKQLSATDADGGTVAFSILAGSLPSGLNLTSTGLITGYPNEVPVRNESRFVVRATDGTFKVDRTFKLFVEGADGPTWVTPAGVIDTIFDGGYVDFQLEALDSDNNIESYVITRGELPPGLSLDQTTGKITGLVQPVPEASFDSTQIGFDAEPFDTVQPWDFVVRLASLDSIYEFEVRVSDGILTSKRAFAFDVRGLGQYKADTILITSDDSKTTTDTSDIRGLRFTQSGTIATLNSGNYHIVTITVIDPDEALGLDGDTTIQITQESGNFPPGLQINNDTGTISGIVPLANNTFTDYTFTLRATKSSPLFDDEFSLKQMTIRVTGTAYNTVTWTKSSKELVI